MTRVRNNGGFVGINYSPNTVYQAGIWSIVEHHKYAIGDATFWNHSVLQLDLLVVGGGGAGGYGRGAVPAGGGGGGGVVYHQNVPIENSTYTIVIGAATARTVSSGSRISGNDSSIRGTFYGYTNNSIIGLGGGGGGAPNQCNGGANAPGLAGGSGGGSGAAGGTGGAATQPDKTMFPSSVFIGGNYGNAGGTCRGGGGGAGGAGGSSGASNQSGQRNGGIGISININGTATYYAGGGGIGSQCIGSLGGLGGGGAGGGYFGYVVSCRDGGTNVGGGGGAGGGSGDVTGGAGGSGVVIFNYPNTFGLAISTTGSPTQTYYGANIVYTYNSSGTITF
jgi:hypothetical protein